MDLLWICYKSQRNEQLMILLTKIRMWYHHWYFYDKIVKLCVQNNENNQSKSVRHCSRRGMGAVCSKIQHILSSGNLRDGEQSLDVALDLLMSSYWPRKVVFPYHLLKKVMVNTDLLKAPLNSVSKYLYQQKVVKIGIWWARDEDSPMLLRK